MSTAGQYEHLLSVAEARICAEAYKAAQYEGFDPQTAADAEERQDDWKLLRDALADGLMEKLKADVKRNTLTGLAVAL